MDIFNIPTSLLEKVEKIIKKKGVEPVEINPVVTPEAPRPFKKINEAETDENEEEE